MKYDYTALQKLYQESEKQVKAKTADDCTIHLGMAAGHALDLIDTARSAKLILNLTQETEKNVDMAIIPLHTRNVRKKLTPEESRTDIAKKIGAYELFTIYNGIAAANADVQIVFEADGLRLRLQKEDGAVLKFDPQGEIVKALRGFVLSAPDEEFRVLGTLRPFYQALTEQFLSKW